MSETASPGGTFLHALERMVEDTDELIERVERFRAQASGGEDARTEAVAERIIRTYSNRSAVAGALTALPAALPGVGTLVSAVGGVLFDLGLLLKHEVEMALSLTYACGYDIRERHERRLAYLLASVQTYEAQGGRNFFVDVAEAEVEAIFKYTPRQLTKLLLALMTKLALRRVVTRGARRLVPFVGVAVCGSMDKVFTAEVGRRCFALLLERRRMDQSQIEEQPVVDATIRS